MRTYVWVTLTTVFGGLALWGWRYQHRRAWPTPPTVRIRSYAELGINTNPYRGCTPKKDESMRRHVNKAYD